MNLHFGSKLQQKLETKFGEYHHEQIDAFIISTALEEHLKDFFSLSPLLYFKRKNKHAD
jgi:hypothetical protein